MAEVTVTVEPQLFRQAGEPDDHRGTQNQALIGMPDLVRGAVGHYETKLFEWLFSNIDEDLARRHDHFSQEG